MGKLPVAPVRNGDKRCRVVVSPKPTKGTSDGRFAAASPARQPPCLAALGIIRRNSEGGARQTPASQLAPFSNPFLKLAAPRSPSDVGGSEERTSPCRKGTKSASRRLAICAGDKAPRGPAGRRGCWRDADKWGQFPRTKRGALRGEGR